MADEDRSYLEMSDDELMKLGPPTVAEGEDLSQANDESTEEEEEESSPESKAPESKEPAEVTEEEEEREEEEDPPAKDKPVKADVETKDKEEPASKVDDKAKTEPAAVEEHDDAAFAAAIRAPFKANGREMQVKTPEEAVQLMQMGANYNKKMAGLKPHLALLKQLENNDLLSDEKIGFLIDLHKKNPEAIAKLVKDSNFDPLEVDDKAVSGYKPNSYAVAPQQLALDEVIDSIKDEPHYEALLNEATKWDESSKQQIAQTPQVLKVLSDHKAHGYFDQITTEVERQKALGKLPGVSDLEAYQQVGDAMNKAGTLKHPAKAGLEAPTKKVVTPAAKQEDPKLVQKRRAASSTKTAPATKVPSNFNPLAMSDEEFAKMGLPSFT